MSKCRVCGCTDTNCSQCVEKTGRPCHWVEPDLCSACEGVFDKKAAKSEILRAMKKGGNFCNNIVGAILKKYDKHNGPEAADELIKQMGLDKSLGIMTNAERTAAANKKG